MSLTIHLKVFVSWFPKNWLSFGVSEYQKDMWFFIYLFLYYFLHLLTISVFFIVDTVRSSLLLTQLKNQTNFGIQCSFISLKVTVLISQLVAGKQKNYLWQHMKWDSFKGCCRKASFEKEKTHQFFKKQGFKKQ